ncbi:flagellar M-ring protein FliF [Sphingomonas sp. Leaf33]|uniref:flagellar basal-body MS-ring/collar protein FliF n=1 Tax=Sphingomonas sp. Leaf33 TaxID=1736215 RepID=UPI0006F327AC|nr:flagellar basal-body MS-ring/collar protein FliF [Sphingomonas sp. Leaf33]KQN24847.1 flagellar M-ring protein FliF [Sphingomonas sp. Leaf33]
MATQIIPSPGAVPTEPRFANPLKQVAGFMGQPAVKRSLPLILLIGLIAAAALAWATLRTPPQKVLFGGLGDADKSAVVQALDTASIPNAVDGSGNITVGEDDYHKARMLLAGQDLPKAAPGGYALLDQLPMGVSRAVEGERVKQARETEIARSIQEIDVVAEARVHLATPESTVFVRDQAAPTASVVLKLQPGRVLSDAQTRSIVNLVAASVPGMKPDSVTIVDQMGTLLSNSGGGDGSGEDDRRIAIQRQVEEKVKAQVAQLLTPLVGAGNFTAEVQADINFDETQATRESYEKQGALRAEQGSWTGNQPNAGAPGGIPGALSNQAPAASTLTTPANGGTQPPPNGAAPGGAPADPMKQSDSFTRNYDLGREVSVTRNAPGSIRRLSVAVLLRDPDKGRRTAMEVQQITGLVQAAVGYNPQRQDQVNVISKKFNGAATEAVEAPAWYQAEWVPMVLRNATALVIALLVLLLGVRPIAKALMKKRDDAGGDPAKLAFANPDADPATQGRATAAAGAAQEPGVSIEMLDNARNYDERVGLVRGFTRENPTRAALAVRDMIKTGEAQ